MSRTKFSQVKKRIDGKQHYQTLIFPTFEERSDDIVIQINDYTRLDVIANDFFKDSTLWWIISVYNNLDGSSLYTTGKQYLRIPSDIQTVYNKIKEVN
jgi:hypothetical protein